VQVVLAKVPVLLVVKVTVPVGVPELDETVAVQLVGVLSKTLAGEQLTVVLVAATMTATLKVPLLPM
jgi:hypothetical protein